MADETKTPPPPAKPSAVTEVKGPQVVEMLSTYASPNCVLLAGKFYKLDRAFANDLAKTDPPACRLHDKMPEKKKLQRVTQPDPDDKDGKEDD